MSQAWAGSTPLRDVQVDAMGRQALIRFREKKSTSASGVSTRLHESRLDPNCVLRLVSRAHFPAFQFSFLCSLLGLIAEALYLATYPDIMVSVVMLVLKH